VTVCLPFIKRYPLRSSLIKSAGYRTRVLVDMGTYTLRFGWVEIEFVSGSIYRYYTVPWQVYRTFRKARSHGRYFNKHIRNVYDYQYLDEV